MRISDWSSDVCSSDLIADERPGQRRAGLDIVVIAGRNCGFEAGREARFRGDDVDDARGRVLAEQPPLLTAQPPASLDAEQIAVRHVGPGAEHPVNRTA